MTTADVIAAIAELDPGDIPAVLNAVTARLLQTRPAPNPPPREIIADDTNLTIEQAAARLRRSTKWIYRHRTTLPFVRKLGPRSYICSKNLLDRWLTRR